MVHGYPFNCHSSAQIHALAFDNSRYRHNVSTPPPNDFPPNVREPSSSRLHAAMTKIILIKSRITTCSLSSVPPTLLATLDTRLPTRSLNLNTYSFLTRLASPCHATPRLPDVTPTTLDLPEMYGRLYSCRLQNRGLKNSGACMDFDM